MMVRVEGGLGLRVRVRVWVPVRVPTVRVEG